MRCVACWPAIGKNLLAHAKYLYNQNIFNFVLSIAVRRLKKTDEVVRGLCIAVVIGFGRIVIKPFVFERRVTLHFLPNALLVASVQASKLAKSHIFLPCIVLRQLPVCKSCW